MLLRLESGKHCDSPYLVYVPCVAYQFKPLAPDASYNVLDGEVLVAREWHDTGTHVARRHSFLLRIGNCEQSCLFL